MVKVSLNKRFVKKCSGRLPTITETAEATDSGSTVVSTSEELFVKEKSDHFLCFGAYLHSDLLRKVC